jgi:hypothetical protein
MLRAPACLQSHKGRTICRLMKTELHSTGVACSSVSAAAAAPRLARAIAVEHIALLLLVLLLLLLLPALG